MNTLQTLLALVGLIYVLCIIVQGLQEILKSLLNTKADVMKDTIDKFMGDLLQRKDVEDALKVRGLDITALEHFNKNDFRELLNGIENLDPKIQGLIKSGTTDIEKAKDNIAAAYEGARARFQNTYEKKNKLFALILASVVVLVLNANVIMLYEELAADQVLAQSIAAKVPTVTIPPADNSSASLVETYKNNRREIGELTAKFPPIVRSSAYGDDFSRRPASAFFGLLLMGGLVWLGAPFWNDILKGMTGLNNALNSGSKK